MKISSCLLNLTKATTKWELFVNSTFLCKAVPFSVTKLTSDFFALTVQYNFISTFQC